MRAVDKAKQISGLKREFEALGVELIVDGDRGWSFGSGKCLRRENEHEDSKSTKNLHAARYDRGS